MKRFFKLFFVFLLLFLFINVKALEFDISAKNVILYNMDSNEILYSKNENEKVMIASLTKIMTAMVVLDNQDNLDEKVVLVKQDFEGLVEENLATAGFQINQNVTYNDLLYGLLLPSGAECAKALSRLVGGSEEKFIKMMNEKAISLGLKNTHFSNTIGLDDEENYSTAKEMATIFNKALENKIFKKIITTKKYKTSDESLVFRSSINRNIDRYFIEANYIQGGKTGTTDNAGLCLASIAKYNDVNYMLVTLGSIYDKKSPHHIMDSKVIYDYFMKNYSNKIIYSTKDDLFKIKVKYSKKNKVAAHLSKDVVSYLPNNYDKNKVRYDYDGIKELSYLNKKGEKLGTVKIYYENKLINTQNIYLNENIEFNLFCFIKDNILTILSIILMLSIGIFVIKRRH